MYDAATFAKSHAMPMLLLTGIPDFYHRFGYAPAFLETEMYMARDAIRALPEEPGIRLQSATVDDAPICSISTAATGSRSSAPSTAV